MSEPHEVHREVASTVTESLTADEWTRDALVEHVATETGYDTEYVERVLAQMLKRGEVYAVEHDDDATEVKLV
jgi:hypothetical protein